MNKTGIVIKREYLVRVRKKSFIILTFLMPVLFVGLILGTLLLASLNEGKAKNILVVDETGEYFPVLQNTDQYHFIKDKDGFENFRKKSDEEIYATLVISGDLLKNPAAITLYSWQQVIANASSTIISQLNNYLSEKKLASYNIPGLKNIIEESKISITMKNIRLDETGKETETSAKFVMAIGMIFTVLIYMFIFSYGAMVMQGVMEEKTNRIIEVMVSSVKPFDLMMGKLIGIGLVGLTQFGLWGVLIGGVSLVGTSLVSGLDGTLATIITFLATGNLLELCLYFILFFIGGYLIYASLFAAIGAMVNSQEDTQQYIMPITILILFAFYAGFYSAQNPDGPLAFWTSLIPFTSPIVMMTRLPYGVSWWEICLSIALLAVTVILIIQLTAKIYRVGILMYGKKPTYAEIVKWLKY
ncbi:MAG: ABC transporter permease [Dysgonamonadaceae bacterium]|jgi:ABC-2 type transport system permease protein|nr:ABC transporter permease [Dysgonamonadaceae bacterium]